MYLVGMRWNTRDHGQEKSNRDNPGKNGIVAVPRKAYGANPWNADDWALLFSSENVSGN